MKTYQLELPPHGPFYNYKPEIKRIEKIINTKLVSVGKSWSRIRMFELDEEDAGALIILKFTCEKSIYSLKQIEKMDTGFDNDYRVVANIC